MLHSVYNRHISSGRQIATLSNDTVKALQVFDQLQLFKSYGIRSPEKAETKADTTVMVPVGSGATICIAGCLTDFVVSSAKAPVLSADYRRKAKQFLAKALVATYIWARLRTLANLNPAHQTSLC